ncbi:MAG TPA: transposase [Bacteroidales bacterium]|nr:transposase [Bacteroidales bacterium]
MTLFDHTPVCKKPIKLVFTAERASSDGGLLLLREVERRSGILRAITNCIREESHPGYIKHSSHLMLTQREFQIAVGYEDANDYGRLGDDILLKICADVAPVR